MYLVCVRAEVKPDQVEAFVAATLQNHRGARSEPGNMRFDVLRSNENPSHFLLYEVYRDEASFKSHQQQPHYLAWRDRVAPMMAQPRTSVKYTSVFPEPWA